MNYSDISTAVRAYAATRAKEMLAERPFHVGELECLIADELRASVRLGVTDHTMLHLANGRLRPDAHMRLKVQT